MQMSRADWIEAIAILIGTVGFIAYLFWRVNPK